MGPVPLGTPPHASTCRHHPGLPDTRSMPGGATGTSRWGERAQVGPWAPPRYPQGLGTQTGLQVRPRCPHVCMLAHTHLRVLTWRWAHIRGRYRLCVARAYPGVQAAQLGLPWTLTPDPTAQHVVGGGEAGALFHCLLSFNSRGGDSGSFPQLPTRNEAQRQGSSPTVTEPWDSPGGCAGRSRPCLSPNQPQLQSSPVPPVYEPCISRRQRSAGEQVSTLRASHGSLASADVTGPSWPPHPAPCPPPLASGPSQPGRGERSLSTRQDGQRV